MIDAKRHGDFRAFGRRGDQNLPGTGIDVPDRLLAFAELAGALKNKLHAKLSPRQALGVLFAENSDGMASDDQHIVRNLDRPRKPSMNCVVLEQMRVHLHRAQIVDRFDLEVLTARLANYAQPMRPKPLIAIELVIVVSNAA